MIPSVGKPKIAYKDHSKVNFESLDFYTTLAQKIIAKFATKFGNNVSKYMLKNEDAISFVANAIMMGDWRWKENESIDNKYKSLYSYRNQCGIWAIKTYVTKTYRANNSNKKIKSSYSLNHIQDEDGSQLENIVADKSQYSPIDILISNEDNNIKRDLINDILLSDLLSDKQKQYIKLYFFENFTLEKIGQKFNVTREAVRQSIKVSIQKIKDLL